MRVEKFKPEHFAEMLPRMWDAEKEDLLASASPEVLERTLLLLESGGPSFTMFTDKPVACFGMLLLENNEGHAWVYFTPEVAPHKQEFERTIRNYLLTALLLFDVKKVFTTVIEGYEQKMPWVRRLGFKETARNGIEVRYELCRS